MATDDSKIILGLPNLPSDELPPQIFNELLTVYRAIRNLLNGVSQFTGIDAPAPSEWGSSPASSTLLTGNATRLYYPASVAITAGQLINIYDAGGGAISVRLASASSASTAAHGIANTAAGPGQIVEIQWLRSYVNSIGGMTPGIPYWLSTTPGAVQNAPPVGVGEIQQQVGVSIASDKLLLDIPLSWISSAGGGGGSGVWGSITGVISAQTDLVAALAGKEAAGAAAAVQAFAVQRANHTGTQAAGTVTGLATVATSGLLSDTAGNLPVARLANGSGATVSTFWRGDGAWATPAGGGSGGNLDGGTATSTYGGITAIDGGGA